MLPLQDVKVIEFCQVAAGPFCSMLLADMGADVIKVEHPKGGDSLRQWPPLNGGYSENFASLNRNKRSVTLDLKNSEDVAKALALILSADVVIENNRPGVMARLGLDYASLRERKPSLIYCSISAYGQSGPRSQEGGFDLTMQAMSGIMSVTGEPGGPPVKCGVPISDFSAGLYGAFAIASLLNNVRRGAPGEHIDVSMLGASLGVAALQTSEYFGNHTDPAKLGSAHPRNAPYQAFKAKDGYFAMAAGNDNLWRLTCAQIDRPDLLEDARFTSTSLRAANQHELKEILETEFGHFSCNELIGRFAGAGIPCTPINTYSEVLADPQVEAMNWVRTISLPGGTTTRTFASALRLSGKGLPIYRNPPALGEHSEEVFSLLASTHADVDKRGK
ncbi:MAG: carnitine dehydratase [Herminiimonas sp.]|nr:carnitine dehydratase [Herminiimonas sp.]MDB5853668.1 carnitine dehydratase [Herminiimonas sp.]